jgi:prepilin-type N-terminal cleavage/methylation domain-containing protein
MNAREHGPHGGQSGFTMVEVAIVAAILGLAMALAATCFDTSTRSLNADDLVARSMETLQRSAIRIAHIARPCAITTYRVEATADDVPGRATAAGEWIEPLDGEARPSLRFQAASGIVSMNAAALTEPRTLRLQLDRGETRNGVDDDDDGMVDEGRVVLDYDGTEVTLAASVEHCSFTLSGRLLALELRSAAPRRGGGVQRFTVRETIYLRNN